MFKKKLITRHTPFLGIFMRSFGCRILVIALLWSLLHEVLHAAVLVSAGERVTFGLAAGTTAVVCLSCNPLGNLFPVAITSYIFDLAFVVAGLAASSRTLYWLSNIAFFDIMSNLFGFLIGRLPNDFDVMTKASPVAAALIILISALAWLYNLTDGT
ncbi:MAG TPA: hypothetical protein HA230_04415 [Candidatus Aenigmarchaeota archaeon]|nr:hypothetical protein [Candidatus Aenigmarchaeota archaeon]